jgi:hypothetical protein
MDDALKDTSTHWPEPPNPAQPYLEIAKQYMQGGIPQVLKGQGIQVPAPIDWLGKVLNNRDNQSAMGMAAKLNPISGNNISGQFLKSGELKPQVANSPWADPKNIELLRQLKGQGLGASEIANQLNTTKNAVIGKLNRLGVSEPTIGSAPMRQTPSLPRLKFLERPYEEE